GIRGRDASARRVLGCAWPRPGLRRLHGRLRGRFRDDSHRGALGFCRTALARRGQVHPGVGGGGLVPLSLALAADLYRDRRRTIALGSVAALQEAGSVFGPLYGATLAAAAASAGGWRFVFWLNLPLAAICTAGLALGSRRVAVPERPAGATIDWLSAALLGVGLGLLVLALYPDDPQRRATNALVLPAGLAAVAVLAGYGWRQLGRLEPLIPRDLLRSRAFFGA